MILSCDPPRHAFLIHFGERKQPEDLQVLATEHLGARVEIVLNPHTIPPTLVAVHFVRHGFRLPFIDPSGKRPPGGIQYRSGFRQGRYFFEFESEPKDYREWQAFPGLTVLVSGPSTPGAAATSLQTRPVLHGLTVDLKSLHVEIDMSEYDFECRPDFLKDVSAMLFIK